MSFTLSPSDLIVSFFLSFIVFGAVMFALLYSHNIALNLPPIGRVNWKDAAFVLAALTVTPAILTVVPTLYLALWIYLSILVGLYTMLSPLTKHHIMALVIALGLTSLQVQLGNFWLNDLLVIFVVSVAGIYFVQGGMFLREVIYLAIGYSIIDVFAFAYLQSNLTVVFTRISLVPLLFVPFAGQMRVLGGGDLLLILVFSLIFMKSYSLRAALYMALVEIMVVLGISLLLGIIVTLPLTPLLTLPFLLASFFAERIRSKVDSYVDLKK